MRHAGAYMLLARLGAVLAAISGAVILTAEVALAQDAAANVVPERRISITRNMDFPGNDLQPLFDTTLQNCATQCLGDKACKAFTYNTKAAACFPKSAVSGASPFEGAISARVFATAAGVLAAQPRRLASVAFLPRRYIAGARAQAASLAKKYTANEWSLAQLDNASRAEEQAGKTRGAMRITGAALTLDDNPARWIRMAKLAFKVKPKNSNDRRVLRKIATSAALNGYLRSASKARRVAALRLLATGVELSGNGRLSIDVLRLAQSISPRPDTASALDRAISLYGFRITEHTVDNNAAQPRICATFSERLVRAGVDYTPYVRLSEPGLAVETSGAQLCVVGVRHGQRYQMTLRKGLPAASGEALNKSVDLNVYVRDRDPSARFVGRAYVLPRGKVASIPIVTVNLTKVDLKIDRVGERNLVRVLRNGLFGNPLSRWDEASLQNAIGAEVWSGAGIVERKLNKDVTTALPLGDAIRSFKPGVYVMRARVPGVDGDTATAAAQWFIVTDLGISTLKGSDGLHVFARALGDATPRAGAKVRLLAVNNMVLGETVTDAAGYARFAPGLLRGKGGAAPELVTVEKAGDFAFLSVTDSAFDLSDRGVKGRLSPPPVDVFLSTDRGAYRAGETVHATALVRDTRAEALPGLPLTAIVTRPDGVEYTRMLLPDQGAGGHVFTLPLPAGAQRGTWTLRLHSDPKRAALASAKFLVEDFSPERIDFTLGLQKGPIHITDVPQIKLDARYLYGAPAAGLTVDSEVRVSLADGLEGYPGYSFGRQDARFPAQVAVTPGVLKTDAKGQLRFGLAMPALNPALKDVARPLKMRALVQVREGSGRPVEREITTPLAPRGVLLGIRPLFDGVVPEKGTAAFKVLAVGPDLKQRAIARVGWSLERVRTRYQWYESYGEWSYEPVTTRTRVASGEIALKSSGAVRLEGPVDWGRYELKVETLGGDYKAATYGFYAGWYASAGSGNTPDTLDIGLDKARYRVGDTARVRLVPRYAGTALVTVVSNRLIAMKTVAVKKGENMIDLPVTEDWGAGAYVSATVIRPMDVAAGHNPARAIGLDWAGVDPGMHRLKAAFTTADTARPRERLTAALKVSGARAGETVYATIAAVDLGILNLTAFKSPDPDGHYFGQRRLGMEFRDVYGRLIDGMQGAPGQVRSGGDSPQADRIQGPPPTEKLLAFFSGPLSVGADGMVSTDFDMPEFNGTVRLMAVVWSKTGVGQASKDILVRDPIVLSASLPRFLAPYDSSRVLLEIAHATGPAGRVGLRVSGSGGLYLDNAAIPTSFQLNAGEKKTFSLPITAPASGEARITVELTTPDGTRLSKTLLLPVRANDPELRRSTRVDLANGKTFRLTSDAFSGYQPGSGHATLSVGPIARFDAAGLLEALDRYPYGCSEQITSKALPLLYFKDVATALGLPGARNVDTRITQAISEVLMNQSSAGSFGLWAPGNGDLWLDSYVSDFLSRARAKGYSVPPEAFRLAMDNLRNQLNYAQDFEKGGEGIAYALMVLAREGAANIGDLRYYADTKAEAFATPLALAQLAAGLAFYGDQVRADRMFAKAGKRLDRLQSRAEKQLWRSDYGTTLRDTAAVLTLASEARSDVLDQQSLARRISPEATVNRTRSTQENMWSLLAANALIGEMPAGSFLVNGQPSEGPVVQVLDAQTGGDGQVAVKNVSGKTVSTVLTTYGVPVTAAPAGGNGYVIKRSYFTMDGRAVSPERVTLNDRFVVVVTVSPSRAAKARLIVNDPLPAGFEIDNPNLLKSGDVTALDWLKPTTTVRHAEFRADRFVAAVDWSGKAPFQLAYIVRAISPGQFRHPAASVEDMYRPQFRARTATAAVTITAKP